MWSSLVLIRTGGNWVLRESAFEPDVDSPLVSVPGAVLAAAVADSDVVLLAAGSDERVTFRHVINPEGAYSAGELDVASADASPTSVLQWVSQLGLRADEPWIAEWLVREHVLAEDGLWELLNHLGIVPEYTEDTGPRSVPPELAELYESFEVFAQESEAGLLQSWFIAGRINSDDPYWSDVPGLPPTVDRDAHRLVLVQIRKGSTRTENSVFVVGDDAPRAEAGLLQQHERCFPVLQYAGPTENLLGMGSDWLAVPDAEGTSPDAAALWATRALEG